MAGVESLVAAYRALGLPERPPGPVPEHATREAIEGKLTNPPILAALGLPPPLVQACEHLERGANLLDSYSETGRRTFLRLADAEYDRCLALLPASAQGPVRLAAGAALSYFHLEQLFAHRISQGDTFSEPEVVHYHLSRGGDSMLYAEIARHDGIAHPSLVTGFRLRQAVWDLRDEILDLEEDRRGIGVNLLLLGGFDTHTDLRRLADTFWCAAERAQLPAALRRGVRREYERTLAVLH